MTTGLHQRWLLSMVTLLIVWVGFLGVVCADVSLSLGQIVYVPVYSHIYSGDRENPNDLAVTLSIRNVDPENALHLVKVDYYDSKGRNLKAYLEKSLVLPPLASTRYVIKSSDRTGGSGANFIVRWKSKRPMVAPLIETIMISMKSQSGVSFTSRGKVLRDFSHEAE